MLQNNVYVCNLPFEKFFNYTLKGKYSPNKQKNKSLQNLNKQIRRDLFFCYNLYKPVLQGFYTIKFFSIPVRMASTLLFASNLMNMD